ncbi:MAG: hypothetical protein ACTH30_10230 [Leucobacter sp.]
MDYQVNVERQRTAEATATAVAAIAALAGNPSRQQVLTTGCEAHGTAFAAFLLIPEVRRLAPEILHSTFTESSCVKGQSRKEATEQLLELMGWEGALRALYDDLEVDGILHWDDPALREVLDEGYAFIQTFDGCIVFDLAPLRAALES